MLVWYVQTSHVVEPPVLVCSEPCAATWSLTQTCQQQRVVVIKPAADNAACNCFRDMADSELRTCRSARTCIWNRHVSVMLATCSLNVSWRSRMTPRLFTVGDGWMTALHTVTCGTSLTRSRPWTESTLIWTLFIRTNDKCKCYGRQ